ncbi:unnamed protein product [Linum trigynum]|uniref:Uncharacterized protein n=1 Tax=Linum trigynum TaxID=586398 RepID=A0AAV2GEL2_9ROSI
MGSDKKKSILQGKRRNGCSVRPAEEVAAGFDDRPPSGTEPCLVSTLAPLGDSPAQAKVRPPHPKRKGKLRNAQGKAGGADPLSDGPKKSGGGELKRGGPVGLAGPSGQLQDSAPPVEFVKALVSADSDSEDENQCFEIKKRAPSSAPEGQSAAVKGRVSQVVAAFETGLTINPEEHSNLQKQMRNAIPMDEQVVIKEDGLALDEYGTNLLSPETGKRKRLLEAVEGDLIDIPTPKKQFVEFDDNSEQVEEASLEWPQSDK